MSKRRTNITLSADMPIVVLHGPEPMLRRLRLRQLQDALSEKHGDLEPIVIDGERAQLADVFDELREYSLLQPYKLVVLDNAEGFVKEHRKALERYAENPLDHATLVLRSDTWWPGNLDKLIAKAGGAVVRCDAPTPSEAQRWAVARCLKEHDCKLNHDAAAALVDRMGPHLMQLDTELAKLALMAGPDQPITRDLVERAVRQSSEEQAWAVQEALLSAMTDGNAGPLIEKVHELIDLAGQADVQVSYFIADLMRKLHVARAMLDGGAGRDQVAKEMKLWGARQGMFFNVLGRVEPAQLRQWLADALDATARPRQGLGDPVRNLEGFCVRLVDQVN